MTERDLARIRQLTADIARLNGERTKAVRRLREKGATWTEVGFALGVTAQAAQQKYGDSDERTQAHKERAARRALKRVEKGEPNARGGPGRP